MKRFNIIQKSTGNILDHGDFITEEQGYAWFEPFIAKGRYGAIEQPELKELQDVLITPAVLDPKTGEEIEPAIYEQQEVVVRPYVPAEYTIEITDVTAEVEAEKAKQEAQSFLNSTDWQVLKYLRHKALGRDPSMSEEEYLALEEQRQAAADKL